MVHSMKATSLPRAVLSLPSSNSSFCILHSAFSHCVQPRKGELEPQQAGDEVGLGVGAGGPALGHVFAGFGETIGDEANAGEVMPGAGRLEAGIEQPVQELFGLGILAALEQFQG